MVLLAKRSRDSNIYKHAMPQNLSPRACKFILALEVRTVQYAKRKYSMHISKCTLFGITHFSIECMDVYGSNAQPYGGLLARMDAFIGGIEAQHSESSCLHLHMLAFGQAAHQHKSLWEIKELVEKNLITMKQMKHFHDHARNATYPVADMQEFVRQKHKLELDWPAYKDNRKHGALAYLPQYILDDQKSWQHNIQQWRECYSTPNHIPTMTGEIHSRSDLAKWRQRHNERYTFVASRLQNHIHPWWNNAEQKHTLLSGCRSSHNPNECRSGFPMDKLCSPHCLFICPQVVEERNLVRYGRRGQVGGFLPARNESWLNAAAKSLVGFTGFNVDVKVPYRLPLTRETHEPECSNPHCLVDDDDIATMISDIQYNQTQQDLYFGGYSFKSSGVSKKAIQNCAKVAENYPPGKPNDTEYWFSHKQNND